MRWFPFVHIGHWAALDRDGDLILSPMDLAGCMDPDDLVDPDWSRIEVDEADELRLIQFSLQQWGRFL